MTNYIFVGEDSDNHSGLVVASAGDVDNDNRDDLIIASSYSHEQAETYYQGFTYLITAADLAAADSLDGETDGVIGLGAISDLHNVPDYTATSYVFIGEDHYDRSGGNAASAGDFDNDGRDDLIIGAYDAEGGPNELSDQGLTYLINAQDLINADQADGEADGVIDLGNIAVQANSYVLSGAASGDGAGRGVSSAGDVDDDDLDDLIIGAPNAENADNVQGISYLITAANLAAADAADTQTDGFIDLGNVAAQLTSYVFVGEDAGDWSGFDVSSAGDVDGDGKADLLISAHGAQGGSDPAAQQGMSYLVTASDLHKADLADSVADGQIDLGSISSLHSLAEHTATSYAFVGEDYADWLGYSVSSAGDVDGDTFDDLIIGARFAEGDPDGAGRNGATYLITAADLQKADKADNEAGEADGIIEIDVLSDLHQLNDKVTSYVFVGEDADDYAGVSVSAAGDVDNDGKVDLIIGAFTAEGGPQSASNQGLSYLINAADLAAADSADGATDGVIDLGNIAAQANSYVIAGEESSDQAGFSVSSAGDVDGDNKADILIGAYNASDEENSLEGQGTSYLIFGAELAAADAADGVADSIINLGDKSKDTTAPALSAVDLSAASDSGSSDTDDLTNDMTPTISFIAELDAQIEIDWGDGNGFVAAPGGTGATQEVTLGTGYATDGVKTITVQATDAAGNTATQTLEITIDTEAPSLFGSNYVFIGEAHYDFSGYSVSSAGDVDGDGKADLIIGAYGADDDQDSEYGHGKSYLVTAANLEAADKADSEAGLADGIIDLANVAAQVTSYVFVGEDGYDGLGVSVSSAGDVDNDGKDDLLIGAYRAETGSGAADDQGQTYLITAADLVEADKAGSEDGETDGVINVGDIADLHNLADHVANSYVFVGENGGHRSGHSVSSVGDIDEDGRDDLIIGAYQAQTNAAGTFQGFSYLVSAGDLTQADSADGETDGVIDLGNIAAQTSSYVFVGEDKLDYSGYSVSSAGDVDDDGKDDLIISAYNAEVGGGINDNNGHAYLITASDLVEADKADSESGEADGVIDLSKIAAQANSYVFVGENNGDLAGHSISTVGDVDGDGKDDLIIGAYAADGGDGSGTSAGKSYLVSAADLEAADGVDGADGAINLANIAAQANSYVFIGENGEDYSGSRVSSAGDVDGDGKGDLMISAAGADVDSVIDKGKVYLITAADLVAADKADSETGEADGVILLSSVAALHELAGDGAGSYVFVGEESGGRTGVGISSAGDVDKDGKDDLIIGAYRAAEGDDRETGKSYLVTAADLAKMDAADGNKDGVIGLGNTFVASDPVSVTSVSEDTGTSGDGITSDNTLTISGTAAANTLVEIFQDDVSIGKTSANGDGDWSFNYTETTLADGTYSFTAQALDAAGNAGGLSDVFSITIDTSAPAKPSVTGFSDDTGTAGDGITSDNKLTFSGTAAANASVEVFLDGKSIGTTDADGDGDWSFDHSGTTLSDDTYAVTAQATDAAGNPGAVSDALSVIVDTMATAKPVVTGITDDTGTAGDGITSDNKLAFSGTAAANASVEIFLDGNSIGTTDADGDGDWSFDHSGTTLSDDTYAVTAQATDAAGNPGPVSDALSVTIDTSAPAKPSVTGISDDTATAGDGITSDNKLTFSGTAAANAAVEVFLDGNSIGTADVNGDGDWSFDHTGTTLSDETYAVTAQATDAAGNTSSTSDALSVAVDTSEPTLSAVDLLAASDSGSSDGDDLTSNDTPTMTYTAELGAAVEIDWGDGSGFVKAPAGTGAAEEVTLGTAYASDGIKTVSVRATDLAGNTVTKTLDIEIDSSAPSNLSVNATSVPENSAAGTTIGFVSANDANTVEFSLTDDAGGLFQLNGSDLVVAAGAALDFEVSTSHQITVEATDAAGNKSDLDVTVQIQNVDETGVGTPSSPPSTPISNPTPEGLLIVGTEDIDDLVGGDGNDTILGRADDDQISGGAGDDEIEGEDGADLVMGGSGADQVFGGNGADRLWSGDDDDTVGGGHGSDQLGAGGGDDVLYGYAGDDAAYGKDGDDLIFGGSGNDTLYGGNGADTLYGGADDDLLFGGNGDDTYVFGLNFGNDEIYGFVVNGDNTLDLSALGLNDASDLSFLQQGDDLVIDTGAGMITLIDASQSDLDPGDILF